MCLPAEFLFWGVTPEVAVFAAWLTWLRSHSAASWLHWREIRSRGERGQVGAASLLARAPVFPLLVPGSSSCLISCFFTTLPDSTSQVILYFCLGNENRLSKSQFNLGDTIRNPLSVGLIRTWIVRAAMKDVHVSDIKVWLEKWQSGRAIYIYCNFFFSYTDSSQPIIMESAYFFKDVISYTAMRKWEWSKLFSFTPDQADKLPSQRASWWRGIKMCL